MGPLYKTGGTRQRSRLKPRPISTNLSTFLKKREYLGCEPRHA